MTGIKAAIAAILLIVFPLCAVAAPYSAIVIDADTGKVLHSENANTRLHPAGLTKLSTLYMAFEAIAAGEVDLDEKVRISANAASEPIAALGMREGQRVMIKDLLQASAIKGANDASTALAEAISGSELAFTKRLDEMAERLGMSRSSFMNAHGLTEKGHLSTAADTAILMVELIKKFPEEVLLLGQLNGTAAGKKIEHSAKRLLIDFEQAILAKTGYTRAAGFNGVLLAESGNRRLITVMFGGKSTKTMIAQISKLTTSGFIKAAGG
jgi:D-alanyl-D-alanine carboxypeptidase